MRSRWGGWTLTLVDTQLINNRLAVAASFTAQVADAGATGAYSGAAAAGSARAMLAQVTSTTNDTAFAATVNATVNALLQGQPGIFLVAGNTVAGVPLNNPNGLVLDASGNIYVIDSTGNTLDKISPDGTFTTLAGSFSMGAADGAVSVQPPHLSISLTKMQTRALSIRARTSYGIRSKEAGVLERTLP